MRRAVLLSLAALVAAGTIVYAFAAREPAEDAERSLVPDGTRVSGDRAEASACLDVDAGAGAGALGAIRAALTIGCDEDASADPPTPGDLPTHPPVPTVAPPPDTDTGGDQDGGGAGDDAPGAGDSGGGANDGTDGVETPRPPPPDLSPFPSPVPSPFPTPGHDTEADGDGRGSADVGDGGDGGGTWWIVDELGPSAPSGPWPDALYDAIAPFLSPPTAPDPPVDDSLRLPPDPPARCARACDPRDLDGTGAHHTRANGSASAPSHAGLLARALEALDAYVRLRT